MQQPVEVSKQIFGQASLSEEDKRDQHTGGQEDLRDAMNDVANTVEFLLDKNNI